MSARGKSVTPDPWADRRALTPARIARGRAGGSAPTAELLAYAAAHAAARDAVRGALDVDRLAAEVQVAGVPTIRVRTLARDRATYLQRPDLGRRLDPAGEAALVAARPARAADVALCVADGLSAAAAQSHGPPLIQGLVARLGARGLSIAPVVIAEQARVAVQDPVGEALGARSALILLGERPGLTSADSLGAYFVFEPRAGNTDAARNCVSNIRPGGLPIPAAVDLLEWLIVEALRRKLSGVALKDERGELAAAAHPGLAGVRPR